MKIATTEELQKIAEQAGVSFGRMVEVELISLVQRMKEERLSCVEDGWFMGLMPEQRERRKRAKAQAEAEEGVE